MGKGYHSGAKFIAARDSRNRRVPGLYIRNGRFYLQLWTDGAHGKKTARKFPLRRDDGSAVETLTEAKDAADLVRGRRRADDLPMMGRKPGFSAFADEYLTRASTVAKKPGTLENEAQALARWKAHLGATPIDRVATPMVAIYIERRFKGATFGRRAFEPAAPRTVRLDLIALRNVLKSAVDAGHMRDLPRFPAVKVPPPPRRSLITPEEFDRLLRACVAVRDGVPITKNGEQLRDFLRLLAYCGCREQEGLQIKWKHVDFKNRRLFVGADEDFEAGAVTVGMGGTSKNRGSRIVDFNTQLEALLKEMQARRAADSTWMFPSPQRGERDIRAKSLRESLRLVRAEAGLPEVGFHDLRHLFCSFCVMAGIDFMTIAAWMGHKDGGILIGKVYGHLLDEHRRKMAAKLTIGLAVVPDAKPAAATA